MSKKKKRNIIPEVNPTIKISKFEEIFSHHAVTWLIIVGVLLFGKTLFFDFSFFDDNVLILDNIGFLRNIGNIFKAFQMDVFHLVGHSAAYYRPILTISFMIDAILGGTNPFMYHFGNLFLHISSTITLYYVFRKLRYSLNQSFVVSLIFIAHPIVSQAVAWIPGRNDSLMALFIFLAFIQLIDYLKNRVNKNLIWHLVFVTLAIFTKETALVLSVIFPLYYVRFRKESFANKNIIMAASGWIGIVFVWFILRSLALTNSITYTFSTMVQSLITNLPATIQFIGKIFLPFNLSVLPIIQDTSFIYGIISIIALFIILFSTKNKQYQILLFGVIWFLAFLLPSFIRPNLDVVADFLEHRVYVSLFGILLILIELDPLSIIQLKPLRQWLLTGIVTILCISTFIHLNNFQNRLVFWENAATTSPHSPLAHRNYGVMLYFEKQYDQALKEYQKALELNPKEEMAHNNLGVIYLKQEKYTEAETEFNMELENNPSYDNAIFNLGLAKFKQDKIDEAIKLWEQTIVINPGYTGAYSNLLQYYSSQKDTINYQRIINIMQKYGISIPGSNPSY